VTHFKDSALGCNSVSWAPFRAASAHVRRLVTGSCDKTVKVWSLADGEAQWVREELSSAPAHSDWVRDVAWAPSTGAPVDMIASCSEDKHVYIWTRAADAAGAWKRELLHTFDAPVWRVSWSVTGNVLAVSAGDHKVTLWKETLDKKWMYVAIHGGGGGVKE
jgi:protein transport protein SEC13